MSSFSCPVVKLEGIQKHPNADSLSVVKLFGDVPVILRTVDFKEGDLAVYVPIDAVVPTDNPRFSFLGKHNRIKAARLRGVFSMGLLVAPDPDMVVGQDVAERLGIVKYEEVETPTMGGENERDPGFIPHYTDIENIRKYKDVIPDGTIVQISEKLHGANARFGFKDGRLYCGSHHNWKKRDENNLWWKVAIKYDLENKLSKFPNYGFFGEVFGSVQDLKYGHKNGEYSLKFFDVFDSVNGRYLDAGEAFTTIQAAGLEHVPILYSGPYSYEKVVELSNGNTTLLPDINHSHMREGVVVKPIRETWDDKVGRVCLKMISENYLLRKAGTELH